MNVLEWAASVLGGGSQVSKIGAIDVIAIKDEGGNIQCGPFHVKLNKAAKRHPDRTGKVVKIRINSEMSNISMKLGPAGEAFFVEKTNDLLRREQSTSPPTSPMSPRLHTQTHLDNPSKPCNSKLLTTVSSIHDSASSSHATGQGHVDCLLDDRELLRMPSLARVRSFSADDLNARSQSPLQIATQAVEEVDTEVYFQKISESDLTKSTAMISLGATISIGSLVSNDHFTVAHEVPVPVDLLINQPQNNRRSRAYSESEASQGTYDNAQEPTPVSVWIGTGAGVGLRHGLSLERPCSQESITASMSGATDVSSITRSRSKSSLLSQAILNQSLGNQAFDVTNKSGEVNIKGEEDDVQWTGAMNMKHGKNKAKPIASRRDGTGKRMSWTWSWGTLPVKTHETAENLDFLAASSPVSEDMFVADEKVLSPDQIRSAQRINQKVSERLSLTYNVQEDGEKDCNLTENGFDCDNNYDNNNSASGTFTSQASGSVEGRQSSSSSSVNACGHDLPGDHFYDCEISQVNYTSSVPRNLEYRPEYTASSSTSISTMSSVTHGSSTTLPSVDNSPGPSRSYLSRISSSSFASPKTISNDRDTPPPSEYRSVPSDNNIASIIHASPRKDASHFSSLLGQRYQRCKSGPGPVLNVSSVKLSPAMDFALQRFLLAGQVTLSRCGILLNATNPADRTGEASKLESKLDSTVIDSPDALQEVINQHAILLPMEHIENRVNEGEDVQSALLSDPSLVVVLGDFLLTCDLAKLVLVAMLERSAHDFSNPSPNGTTIELDEALVHQTLEMTSLASGQDQPRDPWWVGRRISSWNHLSPPDAAGMDDVATIGNDKLDKNNNNSNNDDDDRVTTSELLDERTPQRESIDQSVSAHTLMFGIEALEDDKASNAVPGNTDFPLYDEPIQHETAVPDPVPSPELSKRRRSRAVEGAGRDGVLPPVGSHYFNNERFWGVHMNEKAMPLPLQVSKLGSFTDLLHSFKILRGQDLVVRVNGGNFRLMSAVTDTGKQLSGDRVIIDNGSEESEHVLTAPTTGMLHAYVTAGSYGDLWKWETDNPNSDHSNNNSNHGQPPTAAAAAQQLSSQQQQQILVKCESSTTYNKSSDDALFDAHMLSMSSDKKENLTRDARPGQSGDNLYQVGLDIDSEFEHNSSASNLYVNLNVNVDMKHPTSDLNSDQLDIVDSKPLDETFKISLNSEELESSAALHEPQAQPQAQAPVEILSLEDISFEEIFPGPAGGDFYESDTDSYHSLSLEEGEQGSTTGGSDSGSIRGSGSSSVRTLHARMLSLSKYRYRKILTPSKEQLSELSKILKNGKNEMCFELADQSQSVKSELFLWPQDARIVVIDVEGAITVDRTGNSVWTSLWSRNSVHDGVATLLNKIHENGYKVLYIAQKANSTKEQLEKLVAGTGSKLPPGPIIHSPECLVSGVASSSVQSARTDIFKATVLRGLKSLFPAGHNPFYACFGKKEADMVAFARSGVPEGRIFIVGKRDGELHSMNRTIKRSFDEIQSSFLNEMFPPVADAQSRRDLYKVHNSYVEDTFTDMNFWRIPPAMIFDD